jgi:hypothetical protein
VDDAGGEVCAVVRRGSTEIRARNGTLNVDLIATALGVGPMLSTSGPKAGFKEEIAQGQGGAE